jgi:hypothetical protein
LIATELGSSVGTAGHQSRELIGGYAGIGMFFGKGFTELAVAGRTVSRDERPKGSLLAFAPDNVSIRILTITVRHSLFPLSSTRITITFPHRLASLLGVIRVYHVPHV